MKTIIITISNQIAEQLAETKQQIDIFVYCMQAKVFIVSSWG